MRLSVFVLLVLFLLIIIVVVNDDLVSLEFKILVEDYFLLIFVWFLLIVNIFLRLLYDGLSWIVMERRLLLVWVFENSYVNEELICILRILIIVVYYYYLLMVN